MTAASSDGQNRLGHASHSLLMVPHVTQHTDRIVLGIKHQQRYSHLHFLTVASLTGALGRLPEYLGVMMLKVNVVTIEQLFSKAHRVGDTKKSSSFRLKLW